MSASDPHAEGRAQLDESLALLVHELRAPLTVLVGYLEILRRDLTPADRDAIIATMERAAERMDTMLEGVMQGQGIWAAPDPDEFAPVSLRELANEVSVDFRATALQDIVVSADDDGFVTGDRALLERLLANLVGNAVKYSPEESVVTVTVEAQGGTVRLTVADEGPGVPAEHRERIFERFARLDRDEDVPGLGIGLSIAADVTAVHGGRIRAEDHPPRGTAFIVELPAGTPPPPGSFDEPLG